MTKKFATGPLAAQGANPIQHTARLAGRLLHSETTVPVAAPADDVVAALLEPWTWWKGGRVSGYERRDDGGCRFVLWPAWLRLPARVGIELAPPRRGKEDGRTVLDARFFADFDGPGRYEVAQTPHGSVLRAVWDGVAVRGPTSLVPRLVLFLHVRAETGTLPFPLPRGTGFPGLLAHLEGRA